MNSKEKFEKVVDWEWAGEDNLLVVIVGIGLLIFIGFALWERSFIKSGVFIPIIFFLSVLTLAIIHSIKREVYWRKIK